MQKLKLNATEARQQFFNLLNLAANGAEIIITKNDMNIDIVLHRKEKSFEHEEIKQNITLFEKTSGAIKTSGYAANETELAKDIFIKKYKTK